MGAGLSTEAKATEDAPDPKGTALPPDPTANHVPPDRRDRLGRQGDQRRRGLTRGGYPIHSTGWTTLPGNLPPCIRLEGW